VPRDTAASLTGEDIWALELHGWGGLDQGFGVLNSAGITCERSDRGSQGSGTVKGPGRAGLGDLFASGSVTAALSSSGASGFRTAASYGTLQKTVDGRLNNADGTVCTRR
jgi:hypothetical protein